MMEANKLSDEALENVSGGLIFNAGQYAPSSMENGLAWQAIDNVNGNILGSFATKQEAMNYVRSYGGDPYNVLEVPDKESLDYLRSHPKY